MTNTKPQSFSTPQPADRGASPDSKILYLTYIRSSQQEKEKIAAAIRETKQKMLGKPFVMRVAPPRSCRLNPIAIVEYRDNKVYKVTLSKINCNSWTCPNCSKIKALKAQFLIRETAVLNNLNFFLTLTLDPKNIPSEYLSANYNNTHKYITDIFNIFRTEITRKIKEPLKYIWVVEF